MFVLFNERKTDVENKNTPRNFPVATYPISPYCHNHTSAYPRLHFLLQNPFHSPPNFPWNIFHHQYLMKHHVTKPASL